MRPEKSGCGQMQLLKLHLRCGPGEIDWRARRPRDGQRIEVRFLDRQDWYEGTWDAETGCVFQDNGNGATHLFLAAWRPLATRGKAVPDA